MAQRISRAKKTVAGQPFSQPADGTFGDLGRNSSFGPSYWNADFSVSKSTLLFEGLNLQLRAEFFNTFNIRILPCLTTRLHPGWARSAPSARHRTWPSEILVSAVAARG